MSNPPPIPPSAPRPISQRTDRPGLEALIAATFGPKVLFDDKKVASALKGKVIGQDKVADQVCSQLKSRISQATHTAVKLEKPLGVFLLAGPPGTGKTYFCKVLAENMHDGKGKLLHVDMTQMSDSYAKSSLIGAPQGFGSSGGSLTGALLENPATIVLLDEFEKAAPEVQKIFLTAWNDGFITDMTSSKRVPTTKALFLLTTNAAMEQLVEIEESFKGDATGRAKAIKEALKAARYAPELLDRIDETFIFAPLDQKGMVHLTSLEIQRLGKTHGLTVVKIDTDFMIHFITKGEAFEGGGARDLGRAVERQLSNLMADAKSNGASLIRVSLIEECPFIRTIEDKG